MFIIKFNNMIRNKWIWGFFAVIVVLAFAAGDLFSLSQQEGARPVNTLDGEPVSDSEYSMVSQIVDFEKGKMGGEFDNFEREVWRRLAALKAAKELGLMVDDEELARVVHSDPSFADESRVFNPDVFNMVLRQLEINSDFYDEMMRRRILMSLLQSIVSSATWIPPASIDEVARGNTDSFTITTAVLSNSFNVANMEVTEEDFKAFYQKNGAMFSQPEMRQVVYSVFKADDFVEYVEVPEDEITAHYNDYQELFVSTDTNGVERTAPLEEVRDDIEADLAMESAKIKAYRAAANFADFLYKNRNEALTFEQGAAEYGHEVITSRLFTASSTPVSVSGSPAFVEAALELTEENKFSDAVEAGSESYVMGFYTNIAAHVRPYEEVEALAAAAARADAANTAFNSAVEETFDAFVAGIEAGRNFREVAEERGLMLSTNYVFTAVEAYGEGAIPGARDIAKIMRGMGAGEFSRTPVEVPGGALFFQVLERNEGDPMMYNEKKRESAYVMFSELAPMTWDAWLEYNLMSRDPVTAIPIEAVSGDQREDEYAE